MAAPVSFHLPRCQQLGPQSALLQTRCYIIGVGCRQQAAGNRRLRMKAATALLLLGVLVAAASSEAALMQGEGESGFAMAASRQT